MYRPRLIPTLLLRKNGLVKSVKFKNHRYIGDPINAVRIFNDLKADELVFIDIDATPQNRLIPIDFVKNVGEEANMPFSVGGGIRNLNDIRRIIEAGAEKVVLNSIAVENHEFVRNAADEFGSSTISVCIDVKSNVLGKEHVYYFSGRKKINVSPVIFAKQMEKMGAGEIIIQSIQRDGTMSGYDLHLLESISRAVSIPIVALGGAGSLEDIKTAAETTVINGLAAGSIFVYHGPRNGILINYPAEQEVKALMW